MLSRGLRAKVQSHEEMVEHVVGFHDHQRTSGQLKRDSNIVEPCGAWHWQPLRRRYTGHLLHVMQQHRHHGRPALDAIGPIGVLETGFLDGRSDQREAHHVGAATKTLHQVVAIHQKCE